MSFIKLLFNSTANAKLNNFTRIEPTLQLLGVPFDLAMAKAVMQGRQGAATHLLYQLYIQLQKKKKSGLTATAMEVMQPAATARLHRVENSIYTEVTQSYKVKYISLWAGVVPWCLW